MKTKINCKKCGTEMEYKGVQEDEDADTHVWECKCGEAQCYTGLEILMGCHKG